MRHSSYPALGYVLFGLVLATGVGCSDRSGSGTPGAAPAAPSPTGAAAEDPGSGTAATGTTGAAAPAADDAGAVAPSSAPDARQSATRAWLERWLRAQNEGAFDSYSALYGPSFAGVRRTGSKAVSLDRKAWLAERKRMFKRTMQVTADDVSVTVRENAVELRFIQIWKSGKYADVGEKIIQLEGKPDQLLAISEQQLSSRPLAESTPSKEGRPEIYAIARFDATNQAPLLIAPRHWSEVAAPLASATPLVVVADGKVTAVRRKLHAKTAPGYLTSLLGVPLMLVDAEGKKVCEARAKELQLAVSLLPPTEESYDNYHYDQQRWRSSWAAGDRDELGWDVWKRVENAHKALIATLESNADCRGAVWAYRGGAAAPKLVGPSEESEAVSAAVLAAFRKTESYEEWSAKYQLEDPGGSEADWMAKLEESMELEAFRGPAGTIVFATALTGAEMYVLDAAGKVLYSESTTACGEPTAGLDLDGGNRLTLLSVTDFDSGCLIFPSGWVAGFAKGY